MITFEYRFDILPGRPQSTIGTSREPAGTSGHSTRRQDGEEVQEHAGGSSPQRVVQVDLDSLATSNGSWRTRSSGRRRRSSTGW